MRINIKACPAALLLAAALLPALCGAAPARRPSVVLVILDAVRADRLSPYGYARADTPGLGRFAQGAAVFDNSYSNSIWTGSSFATMLTGRRPFSHGLVGFYDALEGEPPTIQSVLSQNGYETAAFFSGLPGEPGYRLTRGFGIVHAAPATCMFSCQVLAALEWKKKLPPGKDFFLAVHGLDVHNPVDCAGAPGRAGREMPLIGASFLNYYNDDSGLDLARVDPEEWKKVLAYKRDPFFLSRLSADYDRCLTQLDRGLSSLLAALEEDKTRPLLVIVTADHGQLLGEHGRLGHVTGIYEQLVRVPLLIRFPGQSGRRVAAVAEHADLLPTICGAAGLPCPAGLDGKDLASEVKKGRPAQEWAAAGGKGPPDGHARIQYAAFYAGSKKLARHGPKWELFDLAADPGETKDLAAARPADFLELASGYLALSGAATITAKDPVPAESAGNCSRRAKRFEAADRPGPCALAAARASRLARTPDFKGAAAELRSSACPEPELLRLREALKLFRDELLPESVPPLVAYRFSTAPGLWKTSQGGFSVTYGPGVGLRCEKGGQASSAPGCVAPAGALLDCVEKYRFAGAAAPQKNELEEALRKAGYVQ